MKQDEIDRCLVLIYESSNNAMDVNFSIHCDRVDKLCLRPEAKDELVRVLRKVADNVEKNYPHREIIIRELAATKRRERVWKDSSLQCHGGFGGEEYAVNVHAEIMNSMDEDGNDNTPSPVGDSKLDSGFSEWIEKVTDKAGTHDADWLVLEAAGKLLNDLHIRLCQARMLLLTCKCPFMKTALDQDSYGIFNDDF